MPFPIVRQDITQMELIDKYRGCLLGDATGLLFGRTQGKMRGTMDDVEAIHKIGKGWVAEETLAIAVYCVLIYSEDFEKGIISSVNHGGEKCGYQL